MNDEPTMGWHQSPPPMQTPPPMRTSGTPPAQRQPGGTAKYLIGGACALLLVAFLTGAYLLGRSGGGDSAGSTTSTSAAPPSSAPEATTTPSPTTAAPPATTAALATPGNVLTEPAGLFCRDLRGRGYSYSAAVAYWRSHGNTDQMDADKNGIPCETVYLKSDVESYWPTSTYDVVPSYTLPSGLLCRDLQARGIGVYDALRYYVWEGSPSRMDADGNGIPCETVYSNATIVWLTEF